MSWYLFKDSPTLRQRGIKVDGFQQRPLHRPTISLSWGMNEPSRKPPTPNILPATIASPHNNPLNAKVLTETSEEGEEELIRLIKRREPQRKEAFEQPTSKARTQSLQQGQGQSSEMTKQMRYLESSLLPTYRRDSMASIFDHRLSKHPPLSDSRLSSKSNRKNESNVVLGDGFNAFVAPSKPQKDLTRQLQEMYDYDEECRRRAGRGSFVLN